MKNMFKARSLHGWISLVLALPMLLVAVTAVFLAHEKSLGLKDIPVSVAWLPGYGEAAVRYEQQAVRALYHTQEGRLLVGTKQGVFELTAGDVLQPLGDQFTGEMRAFAELDGQWYGAGREGLWHFDHTAQQWQQQSKGDFHSLTRHGDTLLASDKDGRGLRLQQGQWMSDSPWQAGLAALPVVMTEQVTLGKLIKDLHTGKALVGPTWEWAFIDLVGIVLAFLALTGVFMWWRSQRQQARLHSTQVVKQESSEAAGQTPITLKG